MAFGKVHYRWDEAKLDGGNGGTVRAAMIISSIFHFGEITCGIAAFETITERIRIGYAAIIG